MSKEAAYFLLLGMTYDLLPKKDFANQMISKGSTTAATTLQLIREGKTRDLKVLMNAVEQLIPDFAIPANIREASSLLS